MIRYLITLTFFIISTQAHAIAMSGEQIICGPSVIFEGSISEIDPIPCRASDLPDGSVAKNCGFNLTITTNEIYSRKTPEPAGTQLALIQKNHAVVVKAYYPNSFHFGRFVEKTENLAELLQGKAFIFGVSAIEPKSRPVAAELEIRKQHDTARLGGGIWEQSSKDFILSILSKEKSEECSKIVTSE